MRTGRCCLCGAKSVIVRVLSPAGLGLFCGDCALRWWPDHDYSWLNSRISNFKGHLEGLDGKGFYPGVQDSSLPDGV